MNNEKNLTQISTGVVLLVSLLFIPLGVTGAHADEISNATIPLPVYSVELTDPKTGETTTINLDADDVSVVTKAQSEVQTVIPTIQSLAENSAIQGYTQQIEVHVGAALAESFGIAASTQSGTASLDSDVKITVGLTYSTNAANNTVKIVRAFGSTSNKGLYYVKSREFWWCNPGTGGTHRYLPSSSSWNYSVSNSWGAYSAQYPPYAITDAVVGVYGMDGSRVISVKFNANA